MNTLTLAEVVAEKNKFDYSTFVMANQFVAVERDDPETKAGTFELPEKYQKQKNIGTVVALNPDNKLNLNVGDKVMFFHILYEQEKTMLFIKEEHILCVIP
jgi:co-chaperonin GroES (HSP10)